MPRVVVAVAACVCALAAHRPPSTLTSVSSLTAELLAVPLALDIDWAPQPRLGWIVTGGAQVSYRVLVSANAAVPAGEVWDSGVVASPISAAILLAHALAYETRYFWRVNVTDSTGAGAASPVSTFLTCPPPTAWTVDAVWIGGANQMRTSFTLPGGGAGGGVVTARLYVSGLGIFAAYMNGARVGPSVLSPGWATLPPARHVYEVFDVTSLIIPGGENVLGLRLGQGKWSYMSAQCDAGGEVPCDGAIARLVVVDSSGSQTVIGTAPGQGSGWLGTPSPITFDSLFDGETYNGTIAAVQAGWDAPGFTPPPSWVPLTAMNATLVPSLLSPLETTIRVAANVSAISVTPLVLPNGTVSSDTFIFDLGMNIAGYCTATLPPAPGGTVVSLGHAEIVNAPGPSAGIHNTYGASAPPRKCHGDRGNCADQLDTYMYVGTGEAEVYTPTFTFHGFRWVAVYGWPDASTPPSLATLVCHRTYSDVPTASSVSFGEDAHAVGRRVAYLPTAGGRGGEGAARPMPLTPVLQAIQDAIVLTEANNVLSHPSDCPTREKRGWLGDAQVSVHQALYNFEATAFYENWLRTLGDTISMGCSMPVTAQSPVLSYEGAAGVSGARPAGYQCCGNESSFGCQPGRTPMDATGGLPGERPRRLAQVGGLARPDRR